MKIHLISSDEFLHLVYQRTTQFLRWIQKPEAFVVRGMFDPEEIRSLRDSSFARGQATDPSWHPLYDDCPDYHRVHDNYPKAHVKSRMHAFYYHGWYEQNRELFAKFDVLFKAKNHLGCFRPDSFLGNTPSQGPVARVLVHQYPKGGGYQAEHVDPHTPFAQLQTLIQASEPGVDYQTGGLHARTDEDSPAFHIDPHTELGDVMMLSPGIPHQVAPVDPDEPYGLNSNDGRWIVMPIILYSDYEGSRVQRPQQVKAG